MKKTTKKLISIFLSLLMVLSLIPTGTMSAYAADNCGDCLTCGHGPNAHAEGTCWTCKSNKSGGCYTTYNYVPCVLSMEHEGDHSATAPCGLCVGCGHEQAFHYSGHCFMCWSAESGSCESKDNYTACALEKGHSGDHSATAPPCGKCVNCGHAGHGTFPSNHTVCSDCTSKGGACRGSNIFNAKVCVLPEGHTGPCSATAPTVGICSACNGTGYTYFTGCVYPDHNLDIDDYGYCDECGSTEMNVVCETCNGTGGTATADDFSIDLTLGNGKNNGLSAAYNKTWNSANSIECYTSKLVDGSWVSNNDDTWVAGTTYGIRIYAYAASASFDPTADYSECFNLPDGVSLDQSYAEAVGSKTCTYTNGIGVSSYGGDENNWLLAFFSFTPAPAGNLCPDFSVLDDRYYAHAYVTEIIENTGTLAFYDPQSNDPTRLIFGNISTGNLSERYKNVNEENTWYHYNKATDKYDKCSAQGEGSHPAFHKGYALKYVDTQWLFGGVIPVYEGDMVYTAITDSGDECYAYYNGEKFEYGVGFTSVIVKIDGDTIYFCSDHTGDYGTLCDNCTLPCGLCTECGHPWSKHDPVGDCCSLCPVGDGCFDEILGEECVLKSGHDGEHDPWLTITNTDDINAILTKVAGEYKDAEYPDDYSIKISGNATDGFSFVYKTDGLDYNAVFVKAKQKGNEVYLEINFDIDSTTYQAGFTFKFDSQGKLTNCYQVTYEDGDVADYYMYPYTHVHTWDNGTCTLDGTTCSHTNMTTSDATCGTCGITNPSYVPPHTHTFDTTKWTSDSTSHWHAATCGHSSEKSSLANHSGGIATCTALAKCSVCQADYGQLAPHSFNTTASSSLASAATCTAAATYYVKCDNCTAVSNTKTVSVGQPLAHSYGTTASSSLASNATCTEAATYYVKCNNCTSVSNTKTVSVGQPNGHSYGTVASTTKATDATCTEAATYYVKCNNCTVVSNTQTVPVGQPNGHSFATTWTSNDNTHWHAATCGHTEQKSGEANHTYGTTGDARFTCTVCQAVNQTKKTEAELADAKSLARTSIGLNTIFDSNEDVEAIANQAYTDIDNATSIDDVNSIKNQAIADINAAKELAAAKADAKADVDKALGESKNEKAIEVANKAKKNIDNAKSIEDVNAIKNQAVKDIYAIRHPATEEEKKEEEKQEETPVAPAPVTEEVYVTKAIVPRKSKIKVTVNKVDGVDGYQIQYGRVKSFKKSKKTITTKKTAKTIKVKKPGKKYYVRVRSFKIVNGKKVYSNWSKIKSIKTK